MNFRLDWNEKKLTGEVRKICKEATRKRAVDIAIDAKMNVPVEKGDLLFTIEVVQFEKPDAVGAYVKAGGENLGHVARFVELGTPGTVFKAGKKKGKQRRPVKANPYLRPALKKHGAGFPDDFKDKLK